MADVLLVEKADSIATLTLNRPQAMNALSTELRRAIIEAFADVSRDESVGAVILTGAGKAFCAGLDLKELGRESGVGSASRPAPIGREGAEAGPGGESAGADRDEPLVTQAPGGAIAGGNMMDAIEACPKPIIGAINGAAVTGGFELALACDVLIASPAARFADTHSRVGVLPGWGLSQRLPRLIGIFRAKELSLTGNFLSAVQAVEWGLVNRVVEPKALLPTCKALARDMLSCDPATMRGYKALIDRGFGMSFADAMRLERAASLEHAKRVRPDEIAARRRSIQERGRRQHRSA